MRDERNEDFGETTNEIKYIVAIFIPLMMITAGLAAYWVKIIK